MRARHTSVLALDQDIFATTPGHLPKTAQLRRLIRGGDVYTGDFDAHTTLADEGADAIEPGKPSTPEEGVATLARLDRRDLKRAANRASEFIRKCKPSALMRNLQRLTSRRRLRGISGRRLIILRPWYGRWWHSFLEVLDWRGGASAAQRLFEARLPASPNQRIQ